MTGSCQKTEAVARLETTNYQRQLPELIKKGVDHFSHLSGICGNILFGHLLISFNNKKIKFSLSSFRLSFKTISCLASVNFQVCIEVNYGQLGNFD